jgi:hypothetical protein
MSIFYGILIAIGFFAIITLIQSWRKQRAWRGTVTKIEEKPAENIDGLDYKEHVEIYYRTDDGKTGKIRLYRKKYMALYPTLKEGDRLVKHPGEVYPGKEG